MKRLKRGWIWLLPWLILLCAIFVCIAAFCMQNRASAQYKAVYTLYVTPDTDQAVQPERLARECQLLTETDSFRETVLANVVSDGKSRMQIKSVHDTCVLELSVVGPDAGVVSSLANAAGDELCRQLPQVLPVQEAQAMQRAPISAAADRSLDRIWLFMVVAVALLASVLLIVCFSGGEEMLSSSSLQAEEFCLGAIHDTRRCEKLCRKKYGTLWNSAEHGMLEEIRQLVLRLRVSPTDHKAVSFLFTALKNDAQDEVVSALVALELAHQGFRVLFVEAADSAAKMEKLLDAPVKNDIYDYLGGCRMENVFSYTAMSMLFYMRAYHPKQTVPSFAALPSFAKLMNSARSYFDFIIVHAAPEKEKADAAMLCLHTDAVVLLAREESCTLEQIEHTARKFARMRRPARGVVFTGL